MACSPTPETLGHPPLCNDNRPLFGPACGGPQNLAGEVESLSHINRWIAAPGRSAALPGVMVGVVIPAAFTISARGAVVVFARERLDRATARRGPRYSVALLCDLLLQRRSRFGHCRSGSRLRRIVRLCWRHSRRGRNGQSRVPAGQCRASTGLAGRNQLLVVDGQWRLRLMSRPAPPETCGKASIRLGPAAPARAPRPSLRQAHGGDLLSAIASIRRASEDRVSARLPPTGSSQLRSLAIRIAVRVAAGSCRSACKLSNVSSVQAGSSPSSHACTCESKRKS